ncbi:MAG: GEVED domain-containing protein, partial [Crocinitomicaceae bacterium]|nr:GEVED domain-containing protein [Crocinitomicaceae bacterium]
GNSWMFRGINLTAGTTYLVKFYARQDAATIGGAQISASFGSAPNIASMTSTVVPSTELTLGGYQEMLGFYTPTTSGIYYLGIHGVKTTANWYITLDDISVMVAPTCLSPTLGSVTGTTLTSATVTWTENGSATDWDIEYGLTGFTPTGVPTVSVTSNPAILTNLTANSNYEFYVRSVCSLTDKSTWAGPYSFLTGYCEVSILYTSDHTSSFTTNGALDNVTYTATSNAPGGYSNQLTQTFTSFATQQVNFSHSYVGGGNGLKIWVDWNNDLDFDDAGEELFFLANSNATKTGTFTIPATVAMGDYRMRVRSQYGSTVSPPSCGEVNYGTTIDFNLTIATPPTCLAPTAITGTNITSTSAILAWTENGTSTDWEIQYGTGSFVPTTAPSIAVTTNPHSLTNLQPSSTYRFYVRSRCSATDSSYWAGPFVFTTECGPISAFPWTENFDNMTAVATGVFPLCWVDENPGVWASTNATASTLTSGPLSGPNNIRIRYNSNATIWTPQFDLVAGQTYEFSFSWGGDSYSAWDGGVYVNNTASFASATMLGAKFVENGDPTTLAYRPEIYCFTPTTSGVYTFGIKVIETGNNWYMSFDDFALRQIVTVPGIDGSFTACLTGAAVDLNTVITTTSTDGSWNFGLNPNAVDTAGMFNTASVPAGVHEFLYITAGCAPDTTIATITVVRPSSAGEDGSLAVCRNQPFNLLQGLTGLADFGGVWTSPNSQVVPNGNTTSSNIPGQYNFQYIVTNGVCPADTANVVVNVQGCDYLGLEDLAFEAFNMYPNPSSDVVFITNSGSTEVFNYEVLDMNGRVILKANNAINGSTTTELDLRQVEIGVYLIRVFNDNADKTFRVVKN